VPKGLNPSKPSSPATYNRVFREIDHSGRKLNQLLKFCTSILYNKYKKMIRSCRKLGRSGKNWSLCKNPTKIVLVALYRVK
jgi:hypothetical protein